MIYTDLWVFTGTWCKDAPFEVLWIFEFPEDPGIYIDSLGRQHGSAYSLNTMLAFAREGKVKELSPSWVDVGL